MKTPRNSRCGFIELRALLALLLCLAAGGLAFFAFSASAQQQGPPATPDAPQAIYRGVLPVVQFDVSPPLSELAQRQPTIAEVEGERNDDPPSKFEGPLGPQDVDTMVQTEVGKREIPAPIVSFDGFSGTGATPPDPVAAVGLSHVVVMANSRFAIYTKTGTLLVGSNINSLWSGFGGACENENAGDPIVLYDQRADRWILTQFTAAGPTYFNCVAVSQTNNPTGSYFRYAISSGSNFPDYPKYGTWTNAYLITTREQNAGSDVGIGVYALNRAQMIAGNPSPTVISFLAEPGATPYRVGHGLLPADIDGFTEPPPGSPAYVIGTQDNGGPFGAPSDAINLWKFVINFTTPASSTFTLTNTIPVGAFDSMFPCSPGSRDCIPQPGTATKIDHLGYRQRPLFRAAYRNFGSHEAIVTNQSVEAPGTIAGIRWWELRSPNSSPTIFQQGTYAPGVGDGIHRWMGSMAMDREGNIALGYSASNASVFPSVRYTGRLASDALGTLPQGEGIIVAGGGSQTGSARWGDYTAMVIDPTDDATFWYVNQYYPVTSATTWRLRVGSFRLAGNCDDYAFAEARGSIVPGTVDIGNHCDDCSTPIALPFPVSIYGQTFTSAAAGSNGHLTFGTISNAFNPSCIPNSPANYTLAPYWTDQCTGDCLNVVCTGCGIFTSTTGVAPNRIFNIEWRTAYYNSGGSGVRLNYEVRLFEGKTNIDVIYGTVNPFTPPSARSLSVGVQKNITQATLVGCDVGGGQAPPVATGERLSFTLDCLTPMAVSRKAHTGVGTFNIPLPLAGVLGVEPRSGAVAGDHQVISTFPSAVTIGSATVSSGGGFVSSTSGSGTPTATVNLSGVSNAQRLTLTLNGVSNGTVTGDVSVPMGVLLGDTNGNGAVTASDIGQTKAQSGQPVTGTNFRTDVNANGAINATDIGLVKGQSGTQVPP